MMNRREVLKRTGLLVTATAITGAQLATGHETRPNGKKRRILKIAHITDVHIRPEYNAPERFLKSIRQLKKQDIDFILNGGDSIYAADYNNITRERVNTQWDIWQRARQEFKEYEMYSCLGNHDMWWAAPDRNDPMYGKDYVVKQLGIPARYYSFNKKGWHFVILDSNNQNPGSLDQEQRTWLEKDLASLPAGQPVLVMSHYPILAVCTHIDSGNHTDSKYIAELFYKHRDKKINCISGHVHLLDHAWYNGVHYFCNGAMSGFWWEPGDKNSAGPCWYYQTPPGYAVLSLYEDGSVENEYFPQPD